MQQQWRSALGRWQDLVLYLRPQAGRVGFSALLLQHGRGVAFIRVAPGHSAAREFAVMRRVHAARPTTFRIARPLAQGESDGWGWMAVESGPNYPLGAVRSPEVRSRVVQETTELLDAVLERPVGTPGHWRGSHGDLSPWNLRAQLGGRVLVIDWEDAGFAPPGADDLYSTLTAQLTFGGLRVRDAEPECVDWWIGLVSARRQQDEGPRSENSRLLAELTRLRRDH